MRELYLDILDQIAEFAKTVSDQGDVIQLLVALNDEEAPVPDQDIRDLLSECCVFAVTGWDPARSNNADGIRSWEELRARTKDLRAS